MLCGKALLGEGDAGQGDVEVLHMSEVALSHPSRQMHLLEHDVAGLAELGTPESDVAL